MDKKTVKKGDFEKKKIKTPRPRNKRRREGGKGEGQNKIAKEQTKHLKKK